MRLHLATSWTFAAAAIGFGSLPSVFAWGAAGHEIVATIAQVYLHPSVLQNVCEILYPGSSLSSSGSSPPCHLSRVATWADQVRRQPQYRYSASLHYVGALDDHPSDTCIFPGERGWAGRTNHNLLGAVRNVTEILNGYIVGERDGAAAEEAMKFLIHFVGDMHMPLHLTGRYRGGNGAKVTFDGRITNLHSLWDGLLISKALRTIPKNYTHPFPAGTSDVDIESHLRGTIYDPYVRRVMYEGFGTGPASGRFTEESQEWLSCPQGQQSSFWASAQRFLGLRTAGDERRWDDDVLCPYAWAKELQKLNCEFPIWPHELDQPPYNHSAFSPLFDDVDEDTEAETDYVYSLPSIDEFGRPRPHPDLLELDTPEYAGQIEKAWLVERLISMAGARLAGILNGLFLEDELTKANSTFPVFFLK